MPTSYTKLQKSQIIAEEFLPLWQEGPDPEIEHLKQLCQCPVIRVSALLGCRRKEHYRAWEEVPARGASESWPLIKGKLFHAGIADSTPHPGREVRLWQRILVDGDPVVITGKPDLLRPTTNGQSTRLLDYKTSGGLLPKEPRDSDEMQLRIYAWLVESNFGPQAQFHGRMVHLNGKGLVGFDYEFEAASLEEVQALASPLLCADPGEAEAKPVLGDWECNYCPAVCCARHPDHNPDLVPAESTATTPEEWRAEYEAAGIEIVEVEHLQEPVPNGTLEHRPGHTALVLNGTEGDVPF